MIRRVILNKVVMRWLLSRQTWEGESFGWVSGKSIESGRWNSKCSGWEHGLFGGEQRGQRAVTEWGDMIWHRTEEALSCRTWWVLGGSCAHSAVGLSAVGDDSRILRLIAHTGCVEGKRQQIFGSSTSNLGREDGGPSPGVVRSSEIKCRAERW